MIQSCLTAPFKLLVLVIAAGLLYLGWQQREEVRRLVHRLTAEPAPPPDAALSPPALRARAMARLDSLAKQTADSVVLTRAEIVSVVTSEVARQAKGIADSIRVEIFDGGVAVSGSVDAASLPNNSLGPVAELITGRQRIEVRGPLALRKLGTGEWRIDQVTIRGLPLPRSLWAGLLGLVLPGTTGTVTFPVDQWITGLRVTADGAIFYGRAPR